MRYISEDGKVFNIEQEWCEYEQLIESKRYKREQLEKERQDRLSVINKKYEELNTLFFEYKKDYGIRQRSYIAPFYEILDMLCGW